MGVESAEGDVSGRVEVELLTGLREVYKRDIERSGCKDFKECELFADKEDLERKENILEGIRETEVFTSEDVADGSDFPVPRWCLEIVENTQEDVREVVSGGVLG